jgi:hypothetical protein
MPLYDLRCTKCKCVVEDEYIPLRKYIDVDNGEYKFSCPSCGGKGYKILPSKVARGVVK